MDAQLLRHVSQLLPEGLLVKSGFNGEMSFEFAIVSLFSIRVKRLPDLLQNLGLWDNCSPST